MAIAVRAAQASANAASGTTIVMTVPAGVVNGDVLVMYVASKTTGTAPSLPAGWTSLNTVTATQSARLSWRVASSEPASYSVTTASSFSAGTIIALSGANTTAPVVAQSSIQANASSATVTAATLGAWASSNGIDLFLAASGTATTTSPAPPTNYTEPANNKATSGGIATTAMTSDTAYRILSAQTTVGSITATWGTAGVNSVGHAFIFEAAVTALPFKQTVVRQAVRRASYY